ncbi:hypothetical protein H4696_007247 [Amycolatopsis lexingtonensis]|uniref:Uncharacterized protein n=1 Tax=Amycolatopsis lexingtonensis TaxID=218822 RepID=A0ABR9IAD3_9PSEU|nr:hypothetical protein [Amycolatopsis lexingtonensis]MBE1500147.1 hypothetical protein [Amycolatopsis lexingtonensis]
MSDDALEPDLPELVRRAMRAAHRAGFDRSCLARRRCRAGHDGGQRGAGRRTARGRVGALRRRAGRDGPARHPDLLATELRLAPGSATIVARLTRAPAPPGT